MLYDSSHYLGRRGAVPGSGDVGHFSWVLQRLPHYLQSFHLEIIETLQCCQAHVRNVICSLSDKTSKSHLPPKLLPPCPSLPCNQQSLPYPALSSPSLALACARNWGSCSSPCSRHHKEWYNRKKPCISQPPFSMEKNLTFGIHFCLK